ncbi:hypothetical protein ACTHPF_02925 [Paenibacillus sp. SAF-054]|uniref:hypothetical protein n=1 Tax=unclassified Paenibacillus TaxID=185978 RepID=UPI003F7E0EB0
MNSWIGIVFAGLLTGIIQANYLRRQGMTRDVLVATVVLAAGLVLYLLVLFEAPISTLTHLIEWPLKPLYKPLARWMMKGTDNG